MYTQTVVESTEDFFQESDYMVAESLLLERVKFL